MIGKKSIAAFLAFVCLAIAGFKSKPVFIIGVLGAFSSIALPIFFKDDEEDESYANRPINLDSHAYDDNVKTTKITTAKEQTKKVSSQTAAKTNTTAKKSPASRNDSNDLLDLYVLGAMDDSFDNNRNQSTSTGSSYSSGSCDSDSSSSYDSGSDYDSSDCGGLDD